MKSENLKIIFVLMGMMAIVNSYLIARIVWRAMVEGGGKLVISVNMCGEGLIEMVVTIAIMVYTIVNFIYFLKEVKFTNTGVKKIKIVKDLFNDKSGGKVEF